MSEPQLGPQLGLDELLGLLFRDPAARSRNRHFDFFRDPSRAHVRRLARFLTKIREEILDLRPGEVEVERGRYLRGTIRLRYRVQGLDVHRTAFLTESEYDLLSEDAAVSARLSAR